MFTEYYLFLKGILIGILTSAPLGPVGLLCIHRTLQGGKTNGFFTGLGAAAADTILAIIAAFGLSFISTFVLKNVFWLRIGGSAFLCFFGAWFLFSRPAVKELEKNYTNFLTAFAMTFFITITNPITIFAFLALFTAFGLENPAAYGLENPSSYRVSAAFMVSGVLTGAILWWLTLAFVSSLFRSKLSHPNLKILYRILGLIFVISGIVTLFVVKK